MSLEVINLTKRYGDKLVLDIESLSFSQGKKYALLGANGSGKSTLLKILTKLEAQSGGAINHTFAKIGFMPQRSLGFSMSVINNVLLAYPLAARKDNKKNALELLQQLGIMHLKNKNAAKLSGGETQKLALARLLACPHDLLLLDEPTAAMDINSQLSSESLILDYAAKNSTTLIFATHSIKQAERLADEVIFLHNGKIAEQGATAILSAPQTNCFKEFLKSV